MTKLLTVAEIKRGIDKCTEFTKTLYLEEALPYAERIEYLEAKNRNLEMECEDLNGNLDDRNEEIRALKEANRWHKRSEELPEKDGMYLVSFSCGCYMEHLKWDTETQGFLSYTINDIEKHNTHISHKIISEYLTKKNSFRKLEGHRRNRDCATHWKPITPPTEEEK